MNATAKKLFICLYKWFFSELFFLFLRNNKRHDFHHLLINGTICVHPEHHWFPAEVIFVLDSTHQHLICRWYYRNRIGLFMYVSFRSSFGLLFLPLILILSFSSILQGSKTVHFLEQSKNSYKYVQQKAY